jgi:hypothetical protein
MMEAHYKISTENMYQYVPFLSLFLVGWDSSLGTAATTGLLYQPQIMVILVQLVEGRLAGET